jgi:NAD(P)-dependent dehydrogenase (short-subunit alcohol dehydrogenase family)
VFVQDLFGLEQRVVLVGGASRGIGLAICDGLHRAGAQITGVSRSAPDAGLGWKYHVGDLRDEAAFAAVCDGVISQCGRLDGYVHAAGITSPDRDQDLETFRETLDANLAAAYACSRRALQAMTVGGSVVFVSSIASTLGFPNNPAYVASKGGLSAMARALAVDVGRRGIRVNTVAPGYIRTAMTEASFGDEEKRAARTARTALGRWGEPGDVVGAVIFLLSAASAYVTGQELVVDGGWSAKGL